jgi:hypothetical protein
VCCGCLAENKWCEKNDMPQTIMLTLPDSVLQPVQRVAQATKQSMVASQRLTLAIGISATRLGKEGTDRQRKTWKDYPAIEDGRLIPHKRLMAGRVDFDSFHCRID